MTTIAVVLRDSIFNTAGATSLAGNSVTSTNGATWLVWAAANSTWAGANRITDNKGNTFTRVGTDGGPDGNSVSDTIWKCENGVGGAGHVFTATPDASAVIVLAVLEFPANSVVDKTSTPFDDNVTPFISNATATLSQAIEASIAFEFDNRLAATAIAWDGGYASLFDQTNTSGITGSISSLITAATTAQSSSFTNAATTRAFSRVVTLSNPGDSGTTDQEGAQFGNDDANEASHTFAAAQDTNITSPLGTALLIRALINGTGDVANIAYALRSQKNGAGGYTAVPLGTVTAPTLSFGAIGTVTVNADPSFPTGATINSMFVLLVGQKPTTANVGGITTPTGWTLNTSRTGGTDGDTGGYTTTVGADTGNCNIFAYTKNTITGSESGAVTVTAADNNVFWAVIIRLESSDRCTWSFDANSGKDTSAGSVSIVTGNMAIASGDYVIGAMVIPTDVTTPAQFSAESFTHTGTTFGAVTEHIEPDSTTGNDIGGFIIGASATAGSGAGAVTMAATAGGTTTNVRGPGIVLRARVTAVNNDVYVATSANITAGGEATTARLAAPAGKTTGDFVTGRRWDDENGADSIDLTTDDYTEIEWCVNTQSPAANGDFYDFRVYAGSSPLIGYSVTPRWTLGTPGAELPSLVMPPMQPGSRQ